MDEGWTNFCRTLAGGVALVIAAVFVFALICALVTGHF